MPKQPAKPAKAVRPPGRSPGAGSSLPWQTAAAGAALLVALAAGWLLARPRLPPEITPLRAPLLKALPEFGRPHQDNLLWGSYRSGLYFGMRTRTEAPLLMGLMWFDPADAASVAEGKIRHEAQQGDRLGSYGWLRHDGRSYGRQQLLDGDFALSVHMVKARSEGSSGFGGDWAVRVHASLSEAGQARAAEARAAAEEAGAKPRKRKLSLLLYMADAAWASSELQLWPAGQQAKLGQGVQLLAGDNADVGPWALHLLPGKAGAKAAASARVHHLGMRLQAGRQLVQLRQYVAQALAQTASRLGFEHGLKLRLPDVSQPRPNLAVFQVTLALPGELELVFLSAPASDGAARLAALSGSQLTALAAEREALFDARFELALPLGGDLGGLAPAAVAEASKASLSNLLGSMGYFVGASQVRLPPGTRYTPPGGLAPGQDPLVAAYWRAPLFTATPSRSFFPRGFLWDEGFHQLLVHRWDPQLSRDAIAHWLDLMNAQGWIPREQILGSEAAARVPAEFVVQNPGHANPPSLLLPLLAHAADAASELAAGGPGPSAAFLARAWPRLEAWYAWFNTTQAGQLPGSYMWKGRDAATQRELNPKTLMSGLDDYPRASHPSFDERHVDLLAWMAFASSAMAAIGRAAGAPARAVSRYESAGAALGSLQRLRQLHLDADSGQFRDWGLHSEAVELAWREVPQPGGQPPLRELVREVREPPRPQLVPAYGYVSLFPLMMRLLPPESPELGAQLRLLRREELLWTPFGLRSLATTAALYNKYNTEHDAPYWRGAVWVNLNFLTLRGLRGYARAPGPHQAEAAAAYASLRANLLATLVGRYHASGFLWEQYNDSDGAPKGSHPFTGWSALLSLIASEVF